MRPGSHRVLRWTALISIILNVIFNGVYDRLMSVPTIGEITSNHPTYFTPANFAFGIWGLIYMAFIVYGIVQLLPSQRNHTIYGQLSVMVIALNILLAVWIVAFTHLQFALSVVILGLALVVALILFIRAHRAVLYHNYNLWLQLPFCLAASWLIVAFLAGLSLYLRTENVTFYFGEGVMTILMILFAFLTGLFVSFRTFSLVFPAVIAWALFAIHSARKEDAAPIAGIALTCAILLPIVTLLVSVFRKVKTHEGVHHSH